MTCQQRNYSQARDNHVRMHMHPIIIVRHGEAEHNVSDLTGGWTDSGLTPFGERQAAAVAERLVYELRDTDVRLLSSDLKRARNIAEAIAEALGVEAEYSADLRDMGGVEPIPTEPVEKTMKH